MGRLRRSPLAERVLRVSRPTRATAGAVEQRRTAPGDRMRNDGRFRGGHRWYYDRRLRVAPPATQPATVGGTDRETLFRLRPRRPARTAWTDGSLSKELGLDGAYAERP